VVDEEKLEQLGITYEAGVSFSIGKDGRVDRITVVESATGP
jgi:outer membrane biosynthesis protein TonB